MKIELYIDGEKKLFTVPFSPHLAKRKYFEIEAMAEERANKEKEAGNDNYTPSAQDKLDEEDALMSILSDVVFKGQFSTDQLYEGASAEYVQKKLAEAVFGIKSDMGNDEGN